MNVSRKNRTQFSNRRALYPANRFGCLDRELSQRVVKSLYECHFSSLRNLDVESNQGAVTLAGEVDSFYEKQIAMASCLHVEGVASIVDRIVVSLTLKETWVARCTLDSAPRQK
ncbi:MAG: hypothetical protein ACI87E_000303 [Mariniblastus sp.]|jgi:hypothetical protein